jgi:hypothetical protein
MLLGLFGDAADGGKPAAATHVVIVNLDYKAEAQPALAGPASLDLFDADAGRWTPAAGNPAVLRLPPGGGKLVRVRR